MKLIKNLEIRQLDESNIDDIEIIVTFVDNEVLVLYKEDEEELDEVLRQMSRQSRMRNNPLLRGDL